MSPGDVVILTLPTAIFACGLAMLSYRFYAVYRGWSLKEFGGKSHVPGILGTALMLFAILFESFVGWTLVVVTVLGGFVISYLYVYVFRMRVEVALLGPVLAALLISLIPTAFCP